MKTKCKLILRVSEGISTLIHPTNEPSVSSCCFICGTNFLKPPKEGRPENCELASLVVLTVTEGHTAPQVSLSVNKVAWGPDISTVIWCQAPSLRLLPNLAVAMSRPVLNDKRIEPFVSSRITWSGCSFARSWKKQQSNKFSYN